VSTVKLYQQYVTSVESVQLKTWKVPSIDYGVPSNYWQKPYGDDDKDIYQENALRASTLDEDIKSKGWRGVVIKNHSGDPYDNAITNIHPTYDSPADLIKTYKKFKGKWTGLCPTIKNYVMQEIEPYLVVGHVYVLEIESHGFIKEHRDVPDDYDPELHKNFNMLNTFMTPLNDPSHSYFVLNNKRIELEKGTVTWFNSSLPHVFFNTSNDSKRFLLFTGLARKRWIESTVTDMLDARRIDVPPVNGC
jgi:hypothetical protein